MGFSAPTVVYQWVCLLCQGLNLTPIALGQSILAGAKAYPHGIHWLWWSCLNINVIQFVSNECSKLSEYWIFLEYWMMNDGTVKTQNAGFRGQNLYLYSKSTCKWPLEPSKCHHSRRHEEDSNTSWVPQHARAKQKGLGESLDSLDGTHGTRPPHSDSFRKICWTCLKRGADGPYNNYNAIWYVYLRGAWLISGSLPFTSFTRWILGP